MSAFASSPPHHFLIPNKVYVSPSYYEFPAGTVHVNQLYCGVTSHC